MPAPKGNKYAIGNTGGRPPLYDDAELLQAKIDEYFDSGHNKKTVVIGTGTLKHDIELPVITITGLVYYLGFESRQSFYDYEKNKEFSYIIKKARLRVEMNYEEGLQYGNTTGSIFALKNMDWKDKTEVEQTVISEEPKISLNINGVDVNLKK